MTPGPKLHGSRVQGRMWSRLALGHCPHRRTREDRYPLGTDPREEQGLLPPFGGRVTRNKRRGGGIQSELDQSLGFVFVFNFQMNNSVAMPRLKYFSVFSKM